MLTISERSLFLRRTAESFECQTREARSRHRSLLYGIHDLRDLAERRLIEGRCPYCGGELTAANFCLDRRVPVSREGRFTLRNLDVCCADCLAAKGVLDAIEYRDLMAVVRTWPRPVAANFLARLRAGAVVGGRLPRVGSLEWFTGSETPAAALAERSEAP